MIQPFVSEHLKDVEGRPAGGTSDGTGIYVKWQNGPLGRGEERKEPNGAFVETVIAIAYDRISFYQNGEFKHPKNEEAMWHLTKALEALNERTVERETRNVEGTHEQ